MMEIIQGNNKPNHLKQTQDLGDGSHLSPCFPHLLVIIWKQIPVQGRPLCSFIGCIGCGHLTIIDFKEIRSRVKIK